MRVTKGDRVEAGLIRLSHVRPVPGQSLTAGQQRWRRAKRYRLLYLLLLFPLASLFIFDYIPIYGVTIAFKEYVARWKANGGDEIIAVADGWPIVEEYLQGRMTY